MHYSLYSVTPIPLKGVFGSNPLQLMFVVIFPLWGLRGDICKHDYIVHTI